MKKICKNCRFSTPRRPITGAPDLHLKCENPHLVYEGFKTVDNLVYWDASSYQADFSVGPEFGCVHWEKKERIVQEGNIDAAASHTASATKQSKKGPRKLRRLGGPYPVIWSRTGWRPV